MKMSKPLNSYDQSIVTNMKEVSSDPDKALTYAYKCICSLRLKQTELRAVFTELAKLFSDMEVQVNGMSDRLAMIQALMETNNKKEEGEGDDK